MRISHLLKYHVLLIGCFVIITYSCNYTGKRGDGENPNPIVNKAICPKGLSYSECPNPPATHGQIMVHNMTDKSYEVEVEHHENIFEKKRIAPGDGWTFISIIQGKRLLLAKPTTGGDTFESSCTVIGNTQHMMNIVPNGFVMVDPKVHSGHTQEEESSSEIIQIPIRKETTGHE